MTKEEFYEKQQSGDLTWEPCAHEEKTVDPHDIIRDKDIYTDETAFWNHHGRSKEEWIDYVRSGQADHGEPIDVYKCDDKYVLIDDGNHRVAAAQELNRPINVKVTGEYKEQSQTQDDEEEMSM
jgi:hypothetical protein